VETTDPPPLDALGIDPADPDFYQRADLYDVFARLRDDAPVFEFAPREFVLSKYDDIRTVSRDPATFCSSRGVLANDPMRRGQRVPSAPSILSMDPPEHVRYRLIVNRAFTPKAIRALEPRIAERTREVIDRLEPGETVDAVDGIGVPLPVVMIGELLGVPEEAHGDFRRWSDAAIEAADGMTPEVAAAMGELFAFFGELIEEKRRNPADDLVSKLVSAEVDGERLNRDELLVFCMTLLVAGNETTRHLLSGGIELLARFPDQHDRLAADPALLPTAVEEMLRWCTPVQSFGRTVTKPAELRGVALDDGDWVVLLYGSGNRDEEAFGPNAHEFDIGRPFDPAHVAFGVGEHLCLGAALARMEASLMFAELVRRYHRFELVDGAERTRSSIMRGYVHLPVRFSPR
jgi:cytochrome P450